MKAAWIAFGIISGLTATKFVLYLISGSIAVLSEAWHSFADILTTLLVLISILRQGRKVGSPSTENPQLSDGAEFNRQGGLFTRLKHVYGSFRRINSELKISCLIALILLSASVSIMVGAFRSGPADISAPLATGIIFIFLSFGSFFLYKFEENVGEQEQSAALKADSHHNRADMAISLFTGFSLILYHFGRDIDRWVGVFIALYIFVFAVELLVNSIRSVYLKKQDVELSHRFNSILYRVFKAETYGSFYRMLDSHLKLGCRSKSIIKAIPRFLSILFTWSLRLTAAAVIVFYGSTCLYTVAPDEKALLLRFGSLHSSDEEMEPGLHLKLPYPVDRVVKIKTERIRMVAVGNSLEEESATIWTREHGDNQTFISGDNNLFLPFIIIHYRINDVHRYYLTHRDGVAEKLLVSMSLHLLGQEFSTRSFYDLILHQRGEWTRSFEERLQQENEKYGTGLEIVSFCLKDLHPPVDLAGAYEDVVAAAQLRETYLNDARRKVTSMLSRERVNGRKTVAEAESYVDEKRKIAQGEAANYTLRYTGYQIGGQTMKDLLLLKSAERSLKGKKLYLVDPQSGIDDKLLYIENYMIGRKPR